MPKVLNASRSYGIFYCAVVYLLFLKNILTFNYNTISLIQCQYFTPALTSNSYHQQPPYNNGDEKVSLGDTASSQQTMTNDSAVAKTIFRLGRSDTFACHNCKNKGDKWFMQTHDCSGKK
jgi:hypothetical protein